LTIVPSIDAAKLWLYGIPCVSPCWENVIPGINSGLDAANIWSRRGIFREIKIIENSYSMSIEFELNVKLKNSQRYKHGEARLISKRESSPINFIRIPSGFEDITLKDAINILGDPSHLVIILEPSLNDPSVDLWYLNIIWLEKGFCLSDSKIFDQPQNIGENLILQVGTYFKPGMDGFLSTDMAYFQSDEQLKLIPWNGYDSFNNYLMKSR
jgi:hypothetical protein